MMGSGAPRCFGSYPPSVDVKKPFQFFNVERNAHTKKVNKLDFFEQGEQCLQGCHCLAGALEADAVECAEALLSARTPRFLGT